MVQKIASLSIHTRQYRWTDQNRLLCQSNYKVHAIKENHPRYPKLTEENIPNSTSNLTVKKNMVHRLPFLFTHTTPATPIDHNSMPLSEIIHGKVRIFPRTAEF
jgi:hypothetical protein